MPLKTLVLLFAFAFVSVADGQQTQSSAQFSESKSYTPRHPSEIYLNYKPKKEKAEKDAPAAIDVPAVTLRASILNAGRAPVTGLDSSEFKLFVDDVETPIASVESKTDPVNLILVLDISPSSMTAKDIAKRALKILEQLSPGDRAMVVKFATDMKVMCDLTQDQALARKAIEKATDRVVSGTSIYDTVRNLSEKTFRSVPGRKVVVFITDGVDTTSNGANYETSLSAAEKTDATFFAVYLDTFPSVKTLISRVNPTLGLPIPPLGFPTVDPKTIQHDYQVGMKYLDDLIFLSGARHVIGQDLSDPMFQIIDEIRQQYVITFKLSGQHFSGERHRIKLRVARPGLTVRTRGSYIVPEIEVRSDEKK